MKEIRTKLDVYYDCPPELLCNEDLAKEAIWLKIANLLESEKFSYQIYEQEIRED